MDGLVANAAQEEALAHDLIFGEGTGEKINKVRNELHEHLSKVARYGHE
jgi:hypothetical protein